MLKQISYTLTAAALLATTVTSVTVAAGRDRDVSLETLDTRLLRIERKVSNQVLLDMFQRIEALQSEVQELRGDLERRENEIRSLKKRQRDLYLDTDTRLQKLEGGNGSQSFDAVDESAEAIIESGESAATQVAGSTGSVVGAGVAAAGVAAADVAAEAPSISPMDGDDLSATVAAAVSAADEKKAYTQAYETLKLRQFPQAIEQFNAFLARFPTGTYAPNALYWLGEAYYAERKFRAAIAEFEKVINNFPQSQKVSASMLKTGYSYYELADWSASRAILDKIVQQYPNTSASRFAQQRIKKIASEGN